MDDEQVDGRCPADPKRVFGVDELAYLEIWIRRVKQEDVLKSMGTFKRKRKPAPYALEHARATNCCAQSLAERIEALNATMKNRMAHHRRKTY